MKTKIETYLDNLTYSLENKTRPTYKASGISESDTKLNTQKRKLRKRKIKPKCIFNENNSKVTEFE